MVPQRIWIGWFTAAALLYIGLAMIFDPARSAQLFELFQEGLQRFENQLRGSPWVAPQRATIAPNGFRAVGFALVLTALVMIVTTAWI
jgi:hypothetical protein